MRSYAPHATRERWFFCGTCTPGRRPAISAWGEAEQQAASREHQSTVFNAHLYDAFRRAAQTPRRSEGRTITAEDIAAGRAIVINK